MPLQDIRFNPFNEPMSHDMPKPIFSHKHRITESEYLSALDTIKAYRDQINNDLKNLDSFDNNNEKEMIIIALRSNDNNRKDTANQLRMSERTLYRKMKKYGIDNDIIYP